MVGTVSLTCSIGLSSTSSLSASSSSKSHVEMHKALYFLSFPREILLHIRKRTIFCQYAFNFWSAKHKHVAYDSQTQACKYKLRLRDPTHLLRLYQHEVSHPPTQMEKLHCRRNPSSSFPSFLLSQETIISMASTTTRSYLFTEFFVFLLCYIFFFTDCTCYAIKETNKTTTHFLNKEDGYCA